VKPEHLVSLIVYVTVLLYSGFLAVYYLFFNRLTRVWGMRSRFDEKALVG
jgi:hypothetical protein